ncbi:MAG TPA: PIN domain-containing protein [Rhizomicrobium sp.]|nr:PIN domain-containing protein [Rhizomicrobium sp.]
MIILDTDVLSAVMRLEREPEVFSWLNFQSRGDLHMNAISLFEAMSGIEKLDAGHKKQELATALERAIATLGSRVIPFDDIAARAASDLYGTRKRGGVVVGASDTQIAGIAISRGARLATGNTRHFSDTNIGLINPWKVI